MTPAEFIEPAGDLTTEMFPGKDLPVFVQAWLSEAEGKTSLVAAQRAWVYYRAFSHVANRLNAGLASDRKADAAASLDASQFRYWRDLANERLSEYQTLTGRSPRPILTRMLP